MKIQHKYKYESFRALRWGVGERQGVMVGSMFRGGNSRGAKVPSPINPWLYPDYTYTLPHLTTAIPYYTWLYLYLTIPSNPWLYLYLIIPDYTSPINPWLYLTSWYSGYRMCAGCTGTVGTLDTVRTMGTVGLVGRKCELLHRHRCNGAVENVHCCTSTGTVGTVGWMCTGCTGTGTMVQWRNVHCCTAAAQRGNHFRVPPTTPTPSFSTRSCAQDEIEVFSVAFEWNCNQHHSESSVLSL